MKLSLRYVVLLLSAIASVTATAQYNNDIVLTGNQNGIITVEISGNGKNKKESQDHACKSAIHTLVHSGVPGFNNGAPLWRTAPDTYDRDLFDTGHYMVFVDYASVDIAQKQKVANGASYRVTLRIYTTPLMKEIAQRSGGNKLAVDPTQKLPTLMVIPYTKEGEDVRTLLENNQVLSHAVSKLTSAFSDYGYNTKDFIGMLKKANTSAAINVGTQTDLATQLVQNAQTDIVVEIKANMTTDTRGNSAVTLELKGRESQTATILSNASYESGYYKVTQTQLVAYAVDKAKASFFQNLKQSFFDMAQNGREVNVQFTLDGGVTEWNFDEDTPNGKNFKEELEEWMRTKTVNQNYDMGFSTDKAIQLSGFVPMWDYEKNRSVKISEFSRALKKFVSEMLEGQYEVKVTNLGQSLNVIIK